MHVEFYGKSGDDVELLAFVDANDAHVVTINGCEGGHFAPARLTPRRPKIQDYPLSL
jgi:hypothetical protein